MSASFWVLISFLTFFLLLGKRLWISLTTLLDDRARSIKETLQHAETLKIEAEQLLNAEKQRLNEAEQKAQNIIQHAEREAERIKEEAKHAAAEFLKTQEHILDDKVARLEVQMMEGFKQRLIDEALMGAQEMLASKDATDQKKVYLKQALKSLESIDFSRITSS